MKQCRWLELVKDYDYEILYHPEKANGVADALNRKSIGMLMSIKAVPKPQQKEISEFNLDPLTGKLFSLTLQSNPLEAIKSHQGKDSFLLKAQFFF